MSVRERIHSGRGVPTPPALSPTPPATLADLARFRDVKAELIGDRIVVQPMSGRRPWMVSVRIGALLDRHARLLSRGLGGGDGLDYAVGRLASGRQSFRPDASYYDGPLPSDPDAVIDGPPTFAVEVRSSEDYGDAAERELAAKRADYFAAGTEAVWDVDPRSSRIRLYLRSVGGDTPVEVFAPGQTAHAGSVVPGWTVAVDEIFA